MEFHAVYSDPCGVLKGSTLKGEPLEIMSLFKAGKSIRQSTR